MSRWFRGPGAWIQASRLPAQVYLAPSLLFGQACAFFQTENWHWLAFGAAHVLGFGLHLCLVFANDFADLYSDRRNNAWSVFSGGSRVLVLGVLRPEELLLAARVSGAVCIVLAVLMGVLWGLWWTPVFVVLALLMLWLHSFAPARASYRGGGEILQALGVGGVLPCLGFYVQKGSMAGFPWALLGFLLPLHLAFALCLALPDEPSDRKTQKRSLVVRLQPKRARVVIFAVNLAALASFAAVSWLGPVHDGTLALLVLPFLTNLLFFGMRRGAAPGTRRIKVLLFLGLATHLGLVLGAAGLLLMRVG